MMSTLFTLISILMLICAVVFILFVLDIICFVLLEITKKIGLAPRYVTYPFGALYWFLTKK